MWILQEKVANCEKTWKILGFVEKQREIGKTMEKCEKLWNIEKNIGKCGKIWKLVEKCKKL